MIGLHFGTDVGRVMRRRTVPTRFFGIAVGPFAIGVWFGRRKEQ